MSSPREDDFELFHDGSCFLVEGLSAWLRIARFLPANDLNDKIQSSQFAEEEIKLDKIPDRELRQQEMDLCQDSAQSTWATDPIAGVLAAKDHSKSARATQLQRIH